MGIELQQQALEAEREIMLLEYRMTKTMCKEMLMSSRFNVKNNFGKKI